MTEGGRSIVWTVVQQVLRGYSARGQLRMKRPSSLPDGPIKESLETWRASLSKDDYVAVSTDLIDDIASEISTGIEKSLDQLEGADKGKNSPMLRIVKD